METNNLVSNYWKIAFWILFIGWVIGAGLNMARVHGGFFTNYLSDLAFPPWFYIYVRGLWPDKNGIPHLAIVGKWCGQSPERAASTIFSVGLIAELKTFYLPSGIITGTFDHWDIMAYGSGLLVCYVLDRRTTKQEQ